MPKNSCDGTYRWVDVDFEIGTRKVDDGKGDWLDELVLLLDALRLNMEDG